MKKVKKAFSGGFYTCKVINIENRDRKSLISKFVGCVRVSIFMAYIIDGKCDSYIFFIIPDNDGNPNDDDKYRNADLVGVWIG